MPGTLLKHCAIISALTHPCVGGLTTHAFPAMSAGAIFETARFTG